MPDAPVPAPRKDQIPAVITEPPESLPAVVDQSDNNPLGDCEAGEVLAVLDSQLGADPQLNDSEMVIAATALAKAFYNRKSHQDSDQDPSAPIVFIIASRPRAIAEKINAANEPIIDDGSCSLSGRIWVSGATVTSGYRAPLKGATTAEIFEEIENLGLENLPTLMISPAATMPEIRCYPRGTAQQDDVLRIPLVFGEFDLKELDRLIENWYASFRTPDATCGDLTPWKDAQKYVPRRATESFLQGWLQSILRVALGALNNKFRVHLEMPGDEGRCDVMISSKHPTTAHSWIFHATMELKVLRSLDSGSNAVSKPDREAAVVKGAQQAVAYKTENDAKYGLLCCFDLRKPEHCDEDACFDTVRPLAEQNGIELRRYRVYGSSDDSRKDNYPLLPAPQN